MTDLLEEEQAINDRGQATVSSPPASALAHLREDSPAASRLPSRATQDTALPGWTIARSRVGGGVNASQVDDSGVSCTGSGRMSGSVI